MHVPPRPTPCPRPRPDPPSPIDGVTLTLSFFSNAFDADFAAWLLGWLPPGCFMFFFIRTQADRTVQVTRCFFFPISACIPSPILHFFVLFGRAIAGRGIEVRCFPSNTLCFRTATRLSPNVLRFRLGAASVKSANFPPLFFCLPSADRTRRNETFVCDIGHFHFLFLRSSSSVEIICFCF